MSRKYSVTFAGVSVTAVQDLFQITNAATKVLIVHEVRLGQDGSTTSAQLRSRISRLPATITNGSGGSTPTPQKFETGDPTASASFVGANNTVIATTTGTKSTIIVDDWNVLSGWLYLPAPEDRPVLAPGEAVVVELLTATTQTMNGTIIFEEVG